MQSHRRALQLIDVKCDSCFHVVVMHNNNVIHLKCHVSVKYDKPSKCGTGEAQVHLWVCSDWIKENTSGK